MCCVSLFVCDADPHHRALHPPGQDPVPQAADPVPVGGLLLLGGEDRADHAGGERRASPFVGGGLIPLLTQRLWRLRTQTLRFF